jgi:PKD repeat protein
MSPLSRLSVSCRRIGTHALPASLLVLVVPAAAHATSLLRGPYVQNTTTSSVVLVWQHSPAAAAVLEYGTTRDYGLSVRTPADTLHAVPLGGLAAGTRYWYRIRVDTQQLAGGDDFWFETAPDSGGVRALFFGDSGKGNAIQMAVARRIAAQDVDLVMHTGDLVYSSGQEKYYNSRFFLPYAEILRHAPFFPTPGNHDLVTLSGKAYFDNFYLPLGYNGENTYSFDWGDAHFVSVNSNGLSQAVADWVAADLAASGKRWKIVYFHHAVYSCGYHGSNGTVRSLLVPVFEARGVDVVFEGHDHDYQRTYPMLADTPQPQAGDPDYVNPAGPIYIVTGGGAECRVTSSACSFTKVALSISHCTRVQVAGDLCDIEAVDSTGTRIDRLSIRKTSAPEVPFVQLLRGNGGEHWRAGRTYDITWRGTGIAPAVDLALSRDGGVTFETIATNIAGDGASTWTATGSGGGDCRLRITATRTADGTAIADTSDAPIVLEDEETLTAGALVRAFNFQAASQTPPEGYVADVGGLYTPEKGYGWTTYINARTRGVHADPRLDSNAYIPNSATALWECDVPNGSYEITVVAGDPTTTGRHHVTANGSVLLNSVTTNQTFTSADAIPIAVPDGKLRLGLGGTNLGDRTSLCYLELRVAGGTPEPGNPTVTASAAPTSGTVHLAVAFNGAATTPGSYLATTGWDFGDGAAASGSIASHTYTQAGTWNAVYWVTDGQGRTARDTVTIVARPDTTAPRLATRSPAAGASGVPIATAVGASLVDADAGVDATSIVLLVNGSPAAPGYSGSADSLIIAWQPASAFAPGETILVSLQASDRAAPANSGSWEWSFVTSTGAAPAVERYVNFQPSSYATPAGYTADSGALYATARGYGWDRSVSTESRATAAEERLDSYAYVTNTSPATWQLAVPSGSYVVDLAVGSPTFTGLHRVEVEGTVVVDNVATGDGQFVTVNDHAATVADGFLTVRIGGIAGSSKKTKLCYITVQSTGGDSGSTREPNQPPSVTATAAPTTGTAPLAVDFAATGSDPEGGSLDWKWTFGDGDSAAVRGPSHTYAGAGSYAAVVTATDSAGAAARDTVTVVVSAASGGDATTEVARVNFQPSSFATPAGYTRDSGALFSTTASFGWNVKVSTEVKTGVADPRLNSYAYVTNPAAATWELAAANGTYLVTLVAGSPLWTGYHRVVVEGVLVVDNVATGAGGFVTVTDVPVVVSDGRLSVTIGGIAGSSKKTKLCYLDVDRAAAKAAPLPPGVARLRVEPNPANPSVHVLLDIPAPTRAAIDILDVRGRLVRRLFEGEVTAGELRLLWDGRGDSDAPAASGVYVVRAALPPRRLVGKLTLVQ